MRTIKIMLVDVLSMVEKRYLIFPVRLLNEIFERARSYLEKKNELTVYDPCCGGGYSLTVLGFFHSDIIKHLYGSDIDDDMIFHAKKNVSLLQNKGLNERRNELESLYAAYGKLSHKEALESLARLEKQLVKPVISDIFSADCTKTLPQLNPDIIITDIPYGNLVQWNGDATLSLDTMLEQLIKISEQKMILALCMDKKEKFNAGSWILLEKHNIGKTKFIILTNMK